jgi:SAM-dependent methyltransferase
VDHELKNYGEGRENIVGEAEWEGEDSIVEEDAWLNRYNYEAANILDICKQKNYSKIIELGCGPGVLGQIISKNESSIEYTYVDKIGAKKQFQKRGYKGNFLVKDLMNEFDTTDIENDYDIVIANDFLEHIANPSDVLYKAWTITKPNSGFFISVPNWRMGHSFLYRGLFDYDNFIYFCDSHGWEAISVGPSPLQCSYIPKMSSESLLPDHLVTSWNWYIYCEKIN